MSKIVDMALTPADKRDLMAPMDVGSMLTDYPPGLTICLADAQLAKLDLPTDCEPGDMLNLDAIAKVLSVHKGESGCSVSLQIVGLGLEEEPENDTPAPPASRRKRYGARGEAA